MEELISTERYSKMKRGFSSRRSQAWGMDLIIGSFIFIFGVVIFYFYALNQPNEAKENIESLFYDGKIIADSILSGGYPEDWNSGNVVTIGVLDEGAINDTKLERFYNLADAEYARTKNLFNTQYNYYFFLSVNMVFNSTEAEGIGRAPLNSKNLVKITRFTIYKNKPISAHLYVWE